MTIVYFLVPYVIMLFSIIMRSNLTAYIGLLMLGVLAASRMKHKWFAVLLMTLQTICSASHCAIDSFLTLLLPHRFLPSLSPHSPQLPNRFYVSAHAIET